MTIAERESRISRTIKNWRRGAAMWFAPLDLRQEIMGNRKASLHAAGSGYSLITERINDLPTVTHKQALKLSHYLMKTSGGARRIIGMQTDFILGDGLTFECDHPILRENLDRHWFDDINRWDRKQYRRCEELLVSGEQIWPIHIGEDSIVRIGNISARNVTDVIVSDWDTDTILEVHVQGQNDPKKKRYGVVRRDLNSGRFMMGDEAIATAQITSLKSMLDGKPLDGLCFWFGINRISEQTRGLPELLPLADWIDGGEHILAGAIKRASVMNRYYVHVKIKNPGNGEVDRRSKEIREQMAGGSNVFVTDETETWTMLNPELKTAEIEQFFKTVFNYVLGSEGIPTFWFVEGGDTNRATSQEMGTPAFRRLKRHQANFKEMIREVMEFQRDVLIARGIVTAEAGQSLEDFMKATAIRIIGNPIVEPTMKEIGEILRDLVPALSLAVQQGAMRKDVAGKFIERVVMAAGILTEEDMADPEDGDDVGDDEADDALDQLPDDADDDALLEKPIDDKDAAEALQMAVSMVKKAKAKSKKKTRKKKRAKKTGGTTPAQY